MIVIYKYDKDEIHSKEHDDNSNCSAEFTCKDFYTDVRKKQLNCTDGLVSCSHFVNRDIVNQHFFEFSLRNWAGTVKVQQIEPFMMKSKTYSSIRVTKIENSLQLDFFVT